MTADGGMPGLSRGTGFGRGGVNSFAERREAARQRLTSTATAVVAIDEALQTLDHRLAASGHLETFERIDAGGTLRASIRALLTVAHTTPGYDLTVTHLSGVRARVRNTDFGLVVDILGPAHSESRAVEYPAVAPHHRPEGSPDHPAGTGRAAPLFEPAPR
jgi:hypothetical protein